MTTSIEDIENIEQIEQVEHIPPMSPRGGNLSVDDLFSLFWKKYPKKVSKPTAEKAWAKLKVERNPELLDNILAGLERWKESDQWKRDGGQFVPYPATWLNRRGWEDEVPSGQSSYQPDHKKQVVAQQYTQRDYGDEQRDALARMISEAKGEAF